MTTATAAAALLFPPPLPPSTIHFRPKLPLFPRRRAVRPSLTTSTSTATTIRAAASPSTRIVRCPPLDRHAARHNRLRFVRKLTTLLLSKPRHFLPLRVLHRCRRHLRPSAPLIPMLLRYPALFQFFHAPSASSASTAVLAITLTPAALDLARRESELRSEIASSLASKLQKLLMLSSHRRLLLSKLVHIAPDLGLPADFRSRLCRHHPDRFRVVDTSYGRALELVSWDPSLEISVPPPPQTPSRPPPIIDRPPKFKKLELRKGLNLKRRHRDYLLRFQELPEASPYAQPEEQPPELAEKRACAVVREVLAMTAERRTLVDHLTHFRKEFGLPNKLRGLLVRHPEMFYVSMKGKRDSVFLVEWYDDKGRMAAEDRLGEARRRLEELVREGKRMRRERKRDTGYGDYGDEDSEEGEESGGLVDEDGWEEEGDIEELFETGIGDDWEEFSGLCDLELRSEGVGGEVGGGEFWTLKEAETGGGGGDIGGGSQSDIW